MLHLLPNSCHQPLSRREALRAGFLGIGGLCAGEMGIADLLRLQAEGAAEKKEAAVILLFVHGGPSHLETYDMKPQAAAEIPACQCSATTGVSFCSPVRPITSC